MMTLQSIVLLSGFIGFAVASPITDCPCDPLGIGEAISQSELGHIRGIASVRLGPSINAILDPVLGLIGAAIAAICWGIWRHNRKHREAVLDSAWREVLADPHYLERRHFEERRLIVKNAGHHHALQ